MYCGSCIRDNALAAALMSRGEDVLLLPIYTPTLTDEYNVSADRVFFGGVSVFLEQYLALFRHTPWVLDRFWDAPWLLRTVSGRMVSTNPGKLGDLMVSVLEGSHGHQAKEIEKLIHWLREQPKPDVIDISNSMLIGLAKPLKEALGVPICCTLQGEDVFLERLEESYQLRALNLIREGAENVDRFLAVSDYYAAHMSRYLKIAGAKIEVVPLGITVEGYRQRRRKVNKTFTIGHFGRIAPEKGLHHLCEVYRRLRVSGKLDRGCLAIGGYLAPEYEAYLNSILQKVRQWGLGEEVTYHGKVDREQKIAFLDTLDLLAVPAAYDDPKGLALLEAMACGVPVVAPSRGTYTELIERTGGGLLVPPDDLDAFTDAVATLVRDPSQCAELGRRGAEGVRTQYTADTMAERAMDVYRRL